MFNTNGADTPNGVVRIGETLIPDPRTIVVGTREYTAYVWGKRMPRTNEALVRQAAHDLEVERAKVGDPSPLFLLLLFLDQIRELVAQAEAGAGTGEFLNGVRAAIARYDADLELPRAPLPVWQAYLNRVMCGLVEGLSPIQADLFSTEEATLILGTLHYPGFWKDPERPNPQTVATETETTTPTETTTSPTGSTSKPELRSVSESASPSSEP